jgi:copper homeostasis protein
VPDPYKALETLIDAGCERVLTSGLAATAPEGASVLKKLVTQANGRISIMPGAGVRSKNLEWLINETHANEFHTSARKAVENTMQFSNPAVTDAGNMFVADEQELTAIIQILTQAH